MSLYPKPQLNAWAKSWLVARDVRPPKDGTVFVAVGKLTAADERGGYSAPFVAELKWDGRMWVHAESQLSVAETPDEAVRIFYWLPVPMGRSGGGES